MGIRCPHISYSIYVQIFMCMNLFAISTGKINAFIIKIWWVFFFGYETEVIPPNYVRLEKHPVILITFTKKVSLEELFSDTMTVTFVEVYLTRLEN